MAFTAATKGECQRSPHTHPPWAGKLSRSGSPMLSHPGAAIVSHPRDVTDFLRALPAPCAADGNQLIAGENAHGSAGSDRRNRAFELLMLWMGDTTRGDR